MQLLGKASGGGEASGLMGKGTVSYRHLLNNDQLFAGGTMSLQPLVAMIGLLCGSQRVTSDLRVRAAVLSSLLRGQRFNVG